MKMKGTSNEFKSRYNREKSFKPIITSRLVRIDVAKNLIRDNGIGHE